VYSVYCQFRGLLCYCRAMRCISAAYAVTRCLSVCVYVTFVDCVKTNKRYLRNFFTVGQPHHSSFSTSKRDGDIPTGTPLTGASNAGGVGRNRDSEPICLLLMLKQVRCCKHDRWWTPAAISQVVALISLVCGYDHQAPRAIKLQRESDQVRSHTIHNHDRSHV